MSTPQQDADKILQLWQFQARLGIPPEQRKLDQDNEPDFYKWQLKLIAEQMGVDR